jgi:hypothetical protein
VASIFWLYSTQLKMTLSRAGDAAATQKLEQTDTIPVRVHGNP